MIAQTDETIEICTCICGKNLCNEKFPGCKNSSEGFKIGNLIYTPAYDTEPKEFNDFMNKNLEFIKSSLAALKPIKSIANTPGTSKVLIVFLLTLMRSNQSAISKFKDIFDE